MNKLTVAAINSGYSFLNIGQLCQTAIEINTEACRRFGAEKAGSVIGTALFDGDKSMEYLLTEIKDETGISASYDDLAFLGKVVRARQLIIEALELLQGDMK